MAGNEAVQLNPPNAQLHLSTNGSDWLWAAFCLMAASFLAIIVLNVLRPKGTRVFHQLALVATVTASIAYFSMASDLGATGIVTEFRSGGETRQIFYVRYIQWFIVFPTILLELLLVTGLSLSDITTTVFMSLVYVVSLLVGALVHSTYKWGYYVFAVVALFYIWFVLLWYAPRAQFPASESLRMRYYQAAGYFCFMLITYPIAWGCAEGGNVITVTSEMIWYGILDVFTIPVFLFVFLFNLRGIDYSAFALHSGKYTDKHATPSAIEKGPAPVAPAPAAEATQ
ncbi:hypothetical protein EIP86_002322 [Pleurotus ostreatoroseus]|nr:hypothetical protein EIP86_002322 [Pleurotus ostreatoroseus]